MRKIIVAILTVLFFFLWMTSTLSAGTRATQIEDTSQSDEPSESQSDEPAESQSDEPAESQSDEPAESKWPEEFSGENIRTDFLPYFNICAPEMVQSSRIRFFVTMAEGSGGFPEGEPEASDFTFRTNVGFQESLAVHSMTPVADIERYTMLLIDLRPTMSAEALAQAKSAALFYVRSMPEDENVLVYAAGLPWQYLTVTCPSEKIELFGNMEMETYLFSSDKAQLEEYIMADYRGDTFDNLDIHHVISWALNQMTAISEQGVSGDWDSFPLISATPRFGQVIMFTNGNSGAGLYAGGDKTVAYIRGAAIAANAAVHIVVVEQTQECADLQALAEAGRGSFFDPSVDSLYAFYDFVRNREIKLFLADCAIPEDPVDDFFELHAEHTPTGVMAGFKRNPGRGIDLIGTLHYSDASLGSEDFHDYTGGD